MMKKRDLKADLELFNRATPGPWEFGPIYAGTIAGELDEERHRANRELLNGFREGWPHAIERAIKAEELAQELVETLEIFDTVNIDASLKERIEDAKKAQAVLVKAKEVLSDDKVQAGRQSASAKGY